MHKFSLILATVGRSAEPQAFFEALLRQTYPHIEVIVIDQNSDDRVTRIVTNFKDQMPIIYRKAERGLSRARNIGLKLATGDIIAFPDDDCWYAEDILENVAEFFETHPEIDGITGRAIDKNGIDSTARWGKSEGKIDRFSVWRQGVTFSTFVRRIVIEKGCEFDENIGPGAGTPWGAGEDTDYLLQALKKDFFLYYVPSLTIFHAEPVREYNLKDLSRGYSYGMGFGYVMKKHAYPTWFALYNFFRPLVGGVLALLCGKRGKAKFHFNVFIGRYRGWCSL